MLKLQGVSTRYGEIRVLKGVSLEVGAGELVCLLGGNACGKSTTMKTILGLVKPYAGSVEFDGRRIDDLPPGQMRKVRGREIGAVFQDPLTSLNPLYTVGRQ